MSPTATGSRSHQSASPDGRPGLQRTRRDADGANGVNRLGSQVDGQNRRSAAKEIKLVRRILVLQSPIGRNQGAGNDHPPRDRWRTCSRSSQFRGLDTGPAVRRTPGPPWVLHGSRRGVIPVCLPWAAIPMGDTPAYHRGHAGEMPSRRRPARPAWNGAQSYRDSCSPPRRKPRWLQILTTSTAVSLPLTELAQAFACFR